MFKAWPAALLLVLVASAAQAQNEPAAPTSVPPVSTPEPAPYLGEPLTQAATDTAPPGVASVLYVPPYPGAAPATFASASQFVDYGNWRLEQLTARERGLILVGRPQGYQGKRAGGFVLAGVGAGLAATCLAIMFLHNDSYAGGDGLSDSAEAGLLGGALIGAGLAIGGSIWLKHLKRANVYRDEIAGLRSERTQLIDDIKRARRQARVEQRLSFDPSRMRLTF